ncbi:M24 family metallopeptidase [Sciscionella marina]|uniref:M24 family metallopeptidase n=1 Tax=Sciscionella marina TaxID=508770 RepID=UPI001F0890CA|nr:Xaa-Pro peptidase family protein [Sciscionella marina]
MTRLQRARDLARERGVDALLVTPGPDLRYLIGAGGESHERLTCLVLPVDRDPVLVVPKLEHAGYGELPVAARTWIDGEDPHALVADLAGNAATVALADAMPAMHVLPLGQRLPGARQVLAAPILRELRMRKDETEIAELASVGAAIDRVHTRVPEVLRAGRTEAEVGADIEALIVAEGHESAAFVIVGSGPNGASPHHEVSQRRIEPGDFVVVDIGGPNPAGYNSDSTRTYVVGEPAPERAEIYEVLRRAQQAAVDAVRPGATAESIDAAARSIIAEAGYGKRFIHRTGHGIGLDVHEEPYIVEGNGLELAEGMAFSVEPGVYFAGEWGARIEDIVLVTADGVRALNNRPHELVRV